MIRKTLLTAFTLALALAWADPLVRSAPVPKEDRPRVGPISLWGKGKPMLLWPDGKLYRDLAHKAYPGEGHVAVSPDGKRVALLARQPDERLTPDLSARIYKLYIRGIDEKGPGVELPAADLTFGDRLRWSPDGKRIAFYFTAIKAYGDENAEASLCVCDADGKNMKVIRKGKARQFYSFEWR